MAASRPPLSVVAPIPDGHIFVSYSHQDQRLVEKEIKWLKKRGFSVWFDQGIAPGTRWNDELAQAIDQCAVFLFFASSNSVSSEYCLDEINFALERQKPLQVVMIEELRLPPGLELRLGTRQHILKSGAGQAHYEEMLVKALSHHQFVISDANQEKSGFLKGVLTKVVGVVALIAILVATGFLLYNNLGPVADESQQTVAVIPLVDLSRDQSLEYLADGLSEELINGLFRIDQLQVASRSKSFRYKDSQLDVQEIGEALDVDAVLEGTVRSAGDQLRITTTLIDVDTGFQLWSQTYTRQSGSLFEIQDDISDKVIRSLSIQLGGGESAAGMYGTTNLLAYDNYLKGIYLKDGSDEDLAASIGYLRTAIELDPSFARPYGELATKLILLHDLNPSEDQSLIAEARQLLAKAETLDASGDPYITINASWHLSLRDWDWATAESVIRRAIKVRESGEFEKHPLVEELPLERMYADLLGAAGLYYRSSQYYQSAINKFGEDLTTNWGLANNFIAIADYTSALDVVDRTLARWPGVEYFVLLKGKVQALSGDMDAADTTLDELIDVGAYQSAQHLQIMMTIEEGDLEYAQELLAAEAELNNYPSDLYLMAGDYDKGFGYMEYYLQQGNSGQVWILNRFFDGYLPQTVKTENGYLSILESLNLTKTWQSQLCEKSSELSLVTGISGKC